MPSLSSQILSFFLKLIFAVFAAVFALSLLTVALGALVLSTLKWLITGKKPAFAIIWSGMRKSPPGMWPAAPVRKGAPPAAGAGQVVDVEAREVPEIRSDPRLP